MNKELKLTSSRRVGMRDIKAVFPSPLAFFSAQCHFRCPPCGGSTAKPGRGVVKHNIFRFGEGARRPREGFTLIELLVVVLIIGILAAIALPQYQKAVEKSQAVQAVALLKTVSQAVHTYYLEHGSYPTKFDQLDIKLPADFKENIPYYNYHITDTKSNGKWSLQIEGASPSTYYSILCGRLTGKYKGGGFGVWFTRTDTPISSLGLWCIENVHGPVTIQSPGDYCTRLFKTSAHNNTWGYIHTYYLR